jgi:DegV family protein with EDD domain
MSKIAFVTDSTAYLPGEFVKENNITVIPLNLHWDEDVYKDNVDITPKEFYEKLEKSDSMPSTSQPSAGEFLEAYKSASKGADAIVSLVISSGISGTYNSAMLAKEEMKDVPVFVIDSKVTAAGLVFMLEAMLEKAKKGAKAEEMPAVAKAVFDTMGVYFVVDTLKYLHKGGRIGGASAFLGSALDLKPVLYLDQEGKIEALEKVRTKKKAVKRLLEITMEKAGGKKAHVGILHANVPEEAEAFKKELLANVDCDEIGIYPISPVIGTHAGPGTLGVVVHTTPY